MRVASASRALARALETRRFQGDFAQAASRMWGSVAARSLVRELHVPDGLRVIAIGGATLGGSGKTPLAIACALRAAEAGARVVLIGHAYRANPKRARVVASDDDVGVVGDEALVCARALRGVADVVVAPSRQAAVDLAVARHADVVVLDGVAQISPRRADLALLACSDGIGVANACPPVGDLRAPQSALEAVCDHVVRISIGEDSSAAHSTFAARVVSEGAHTPDGTFVTFAALAKMRLGLALAIARPERLLQTLEANGVHPRPISFVGDHRGHCIRSVIAAHHRRGAAVDGWLISEKCAAFVVPTSHDTVPIYVVAHAIKLHGALP